MFVSDDGRPSGQSRTPKGGKTSYRRNWDAVGLGVLWSRNSMTVSHKREDLEMDALSNWKPVIHSFIHSRIYKVPLQEIYSEAPPAQPRRYRSVLSNLQNTLSLFLGRRRISKGESIPGGGTNNGECATLPSCSFSTRHQ